MNKQELRELLAALPHPGGRAKGNVNDTFWCVNGVLGANSMDPTKPAEIRHGKLRCANGSYEEWKRQHLQEQVAAALRDTMADAEVWLNGSIKEEYLSRRFDREEGQEEQEEHGA